MRAALVRLLRLALDLAVIAGCVACILHFARRRAVECSWQRMRAACNVEVEDSLGRVERDSIGGVRGAAYRTDTAVGLVTDAQHQGPTALFGTHEVELGDATNAARLYAFAEDREPERIALSSGVAYPRALTITVLLGLVVYSVATKRRRRHLDAKVA